MKIDIKLKSQKDNLSKWMPVTILNIHEGDKVHVIRWEWQNQRFESQEKADFYANFNSIRKLKRECFILS